MPRKKLLVLELGNITYGTGWRLIQLVPSQLPPPNPAQGQLALNNSKGKGTTGGWGKKIKVGPEKNSSYTTTVIYLDNSLNMSLHSG